MVSKHLYHPLQRFASNNVLEKLGLRALFTFFSLKALRGGPRLLPQIAICVMLLLILTRLLPTRLSDIAFGSSYTKTLKWRPNEGDDDGSIGGSLRIVVFGGGDVGSPNTTPGNTYQSTSWTDVLCRELGCSTHISHMPHIGTKGGSLVSNALYEAVLNRTVNSTIGEPGAALNYSWLPEQYPVPTALPDLHQQVDQFLASHRPKHPPRETLWVFSFGYWDIWKLSALPRDLAKDMLDVQATYVFAQIEKIYNASQSEKSVAYSNFYTFLNTTTAPPSDNETAVVADVQAAPFRILIPKLFDISLTPGFEKARFEPPSPHSKAEETRNAAYLSQQWDLMIHNKMGEWIDTPYPSNAAVDETPSAKRRDAAGNTVFVPYSRREAIEFDFSKYLLEVIVDRQLRNFDITDHNGLGSMPTEEGFVNVEDPCMFLTSSQKVIEDSNTTERADLMCEAPQKHLFWTEFTVGQRAIEELGKQAAEHVVEHITADVPWLSKVVGRPRTGGKVPNLLGRDEHASTRAVEFVG